MGKPLILERHGRKWRLFIDVPAARAYGAKAKAFGRGPGKIPGDLAWVVKLPGGLDFSDNPSVPPYDFPTKDEASSVAHQIGRYKLGFGDTLFAYLDDLDERDAPQLREHVEASRRRRPSPKQMALAIENFNRRIVEHLQDIGAAPPEHPWMGWTVQTSVGPLVIRPVDNFVAMRFEDPARAVALLGDRRIGLADEVNPYSGKWNIHYDVFPEDVDTAIREIDRRLAKVAPSSASCCGCRESLGMREAPFPKLRRLDPEPEVASGRRRAR